MRPKAQMAQHHRRNGAAKGSDGMDPAELQADSMLFLSAAGAISQTPPARTELVMPRVP